MVAGAFGLLPDDNKARLFEDVPLARKLKFLKDTKTISEEEYKTLDGFRQNRNSLFHRHGVKVINYIVDKEKDREAIDKCFEVFALMLEIMERTPALKATYSKRRRNTKMPFEHPSELNTEKSEK